MFDLRFALKEFQFSTAMLVGLWSATKIKETCWERGVKTLDTTTGWTVVSYTQLVYFGCIYIYISDQELEMHGKEMGRKP
jgi:hypothetical protein